MLGIDRREEWFQRLGAFYYENGVWIKCLVVLIVLAPIVLWTLQRETHKYCYMPPTTHVSDLLFAFIFIFIFVFIVIPFVVFFSATNRSSISLLPSERVHGSASVPDLGGEEVEPHRFSGVRDVAGCDEVSRPATVVLGRHGHRDDHLGSDDRGR